MKLRTGSDVPLLPNALRIALAVAAVVVVVVAGTPGTAISADAPVAAPDAKTVDDALDMVSVGSPLISPDGSWVLYSKRTLDWDENEYNTEYWRVSADGEDRYRFIGEDGGSGFQFSPQGTWLSFRRPVSRPGAPGTRLAG